MVSLITPCYNGARFIEQWLGSILAQSYLRVQIIFINDGSTDNTKERFDAAKEKILERGYEVLYLEKENGGTASAINDALKVVAGDYIMLFDVDDILMPTNVSEKADYLTAHNEIDIIRHSGYFVREGNLEDCSSKMVNIPGEDQSNLFDRFIHSQMRVFAATYMLRAKTLFSHIKDREIYLSRFGQNLQLIGPVVYFGKGGYIDKPLMKYVAYKNSHFHTASFSTKLDNSNGYQGNLSAVINMLDIPQDEKNSYIKEVEGTFAVRNFNLAIEYNQKDALKEQYQAMERYGILTPALKQSYLVAKLPLGCFVLKNIPRGKRAAKRVFYKMFNKKD